MTEHADAVRRALRDVYKNFAYSPPEAQKRRNAALTALAELVAERDRLANVLRENEWHGAYWIGGNCCPDCGNEREQGHTDICDIHRALKEVQQ